MSFYPDYLYHHGIPNQKWGVKNGPPYPLDRQTHNDVVKEANLPNKDYSDIILDFMEKGDRGYNLSKWGKDKDHNLLAITGLSGSGKSVLAYNVAKETNSNNINLDVYIDNPTIKDARDKEFDRYLKTHAKTFNKIEKNPDKYIFAEKGTKEFDERWKAVDEIRESLINFSKEQYPKKKVIAEGVQWSDDTLFGSKKRDERNEMLNNIPFVVKNTSLIKSLYRRYSRNEKSIKELINDLSPTLYWQKEWKKGINVIEKYIQNIIEEEEKTNAGHNTDNTR